MILFLFLLRRNFKNECQAELVEADIEIVLTRLRQAQADSKTAKMKLINE